MKINGLKSIDGGSVSEEFLDNYQQSCCRLFHKDKKNVLKCEDGYYYLNLMNLDDDEEEAAAKFICGAKYIMMIIGHAPHLLYPLNLLMMLCPCAHIDNDIINAFPCLVEFSDEQIAWLHEIKGAKSANTTIDYCVGAKPIGASIRDYGGVLGITPNRAAKHIEKGI